MKLLLSKLPKMTGIMGIVLAVTMSSSAYASIKCEDGYVYTCDEADVCACKKSERSENVSPYTLRQISPSGMTEPESERKARPVLDMADNDKDGVMADENPTVPPSGAQSLLSFDEALAVCRRIDGVDLQACIDKKTGQRSGHYMLGLSIKEGESPPKETVTEQVLIRD